MRILFFIATLSLAFAADHLHHQDIVHNVDHIFQLVDQNHNGTLTLAQINAAFLKKDANHDNKVTLVEFEAGHTPEQMALVSDVFRVLDTNHDGVLEGEGTVALHHQLDKDNDGVITEKEFVQFYTNVVQNVVNHEHSHGHHHHGP